MKLININIIIVKLININIIIVKLLNINIIITLFLDREILIKFLSAPYLKRNPVEVKIMHFFFFSFSKVHAVIKGVFLTVDRVN